MVMPARRNSSVVKVRSAFSHLATADCLDMDDYTLMQLHLYDDMCAALSAEIGNGFLRHILNSAGIARFPQWQYDLVFPPVRRRPRPPRLR